MKKFEAVDYFNISKLLSEEEKLVQESVRAFVDAEVIPIIDDKYQDAQFPFELIPKLAELGLLGMTLPEKYSCA
jgi:glutaryl-CoA dehydrogenase